MLSGAVLCLLYLPAGEIRDTAKALAWNLGAYTSMEPLDPTLTHVLFKVVVEQVVPVTVPTPEASAIFVDVSWLEACATMRHWVSELKFPQQRVMFNPAADLARLDAGWPRGARAARRFLSSSISDATSNPALQEPLPLPALELMPKPSSLLKRHASMVQVPVPLPAPDHVAAKAQTLVREEPVADAGVFKKLTIGLCGFAGNAEGQVLAKSIVAQGGAALLGSDHLAEMMSQKPDALVIPGFCRPAVPPGLREPPFATRYWLQACMEDGVLHTRASFPLFTPSQGRIPVDDMRSCCVRITAIDSSRGAHRERQRLEDLINTVGARVATPSTKWGELTHILCAEQSFLDDATVARAQKRQLPVIMVQWLYDCFVKGAKQNEDMYKVVKEKSSNASAAGGFGSAVLAGHELLISPFAIRCTSDLALKAQELGAKATAWKTPQDLVAKLQEKPRLDTDKAVTLIILERSEVAELLAESSLSRDALILSGWLLETYRQRRRLPVDTFAAAPKAETNSEPPAKRQRTEEEYAWQPEGKLTELMTKLTASRSQATAG